MAVAAPSPRPYCSPGVTSAFEESPKVAAASLLGVVTWKVHAPSLSTG